MWWPRTQAPPTKHWGGGGAGYEATWCGCYAADFAVACSSMSGPGDRGVCDSFLSSDSCLWAFVCSVGGLVTLFQG